MDRVATRRIEPPSNTTHKAISASVTNALGHRTQITAYDAHGQPLSIIDPNGLTTTFATTHASASRPASSAAS